MLRLGKIYEKQGEYNLALSQYQNIIDHHADGIYIDEALFFSAEIENNKLQRTRKSKTALRENNFQSSRQYLFCRSSKGIPTIAGR